MRARGEPGEARGAEPDAPERGVKEREEERKRRGRVFLLSLSAALSFFFVQRASERNKTNNAFPVAKKEEKK